MSKCRVVGILFWMLALTSMSVLAQDTDDIPVVALIKFGDSRPINLAQQGVLDIFEEYGYVDGQNVEFILAEAQFDLGVLASVMNGVLERNPDVIIASATPVALMAIELTAEMENPPAIFFNVVTSAYETGIAQASCIKPANISGSQTLPPFNFVLQIMREFDRDIRTIGIIYTADDPDALVSVDLITDIAEDLGLNIIAQPATSPRVARAVAESLVSAGVDAFLIPSDTAIISAIPNLTDLAALAEIPIVSTVNSAVYGGATLGIGVNYFNDGVDSGRMAIAHLNGDLGVATTAISELSGVSIALNLDAVAAQNIELPRGFMSMVTYSIENGESTETEPALDNVSFEVRQALDAVFLETLLCTEDLIAEQQANLNGE